MAFEDGYHFRDLSQVSDEEVIATIREARRPRVGGERDEMDGMNRRTLAA